MKLSRNYAIWSAVIALTCPGETSTFQRPPDRQSQKYMTTAMGITDLYMGRTRILQIPNQHVQKSAAGDDIPMFRVMICCQENQIVFAPYILLVGLDNAGSERVEMRGVPIQYPCPVCDAMSLTQPCSTLLVPLACSFGHRSPEAIECAMRLYRDVDNPEKVRQVTEAATVGGSGTADDLPMLVDIMLPEKLCQRYTEDTPIYALASASAFPEKPTVRFEDAVRDALMLSRGKGVQKGKLLIPESDVDKAFGGKWSVQLNPDKSPNVQTIMQEMFARELAQPTPHPSMDLIMVADQDKGGMTVQVAAKSTRDGHAKAQIIITMHKAALEDPVAWLAKFKATKIKTGACPEWDAVLALIEVMAARRYYKYVLSNIARE